MPRSRAPLRAIRDQLHLTTDADGAHHVRRCYGAGVVVLNFNKEPEMSPLLKRRSRGDQTANLQLEIHGEALKPCSSD
jgi:hypothetical protein